MRELISAIDGTHTDVASSECSQQPEKGVERFKLIPLQCVAVILPRVQGDYPLPFLRSAGPCSMLFPAADEWGISDNWIGMLSSSTFTGMMIGAWSWGSCKLVSVYSKLLVAEQAFVSVRLRFLRPSESLQWHTPPYSLLRHSSLFRQFLHGIMLLLLRSRLRRGWKHAYRWHTLPRKHTQ